MKIKPLKGILWLKLDEAKAGALVTSSRESAVEYAEVLAVGEGTYPYVNETEKAKGNHGPIVKVGDHVFVKSWAIDIISHEDEKFYFINLDTGGLIAIVNV